MFAVCCSDASSASTDAETDLSQAGAPSWLRKREMAGTEKRKAEETIDDREMQEKEALHLDSEEGGSGA